MTKTVYLFDPLTGIYTGTYGAQESPEESGVFITPTYSTPIAPPPLTANQAAVFTVATNSWSVVSDYRDQIMYDQVTGAAVLIDAIGPLPAGVGAVKPAAIQLADDRNAAILKTYGDVDYIYTLAVGMRGEEYRTAEADARAYKAAGYTGTPSAYITGWAAAKGLTNVQSADAIIARADALAAAKIALRNQRFTSQSAMQAASTSATLKVATDAWDIFIANIKASL